MLPRRQLSYGRRRYRQLLHRGTSNVLKKKNNLTSHAMYCNNSEAHSRNDCCCGKATNITYSECMFVSLVIQHAVHLRRTI